MGNVSIGQVVKSIAGRDKGRLYMVVGVEGKMLLLVDGFSRKLRKPKRKNVLHVQLTNVVDLDIRNRLQKGGLVRDEEIHSFIKKLYKKEG